MYAICFRSERECTDFGPLNEPLTRVSRYLRAMSPTRLAIAVVILVGLIGLVVFLGVFPASFVYVEYHEVSSGDLDLIFNFFFFLIDYPIYFDTSMELSILYFKGLLINSTHPDIMLPYAAFHLDFHCLIAKVPFYQYLE